MILWAKNLLLSIVYGLNKVERSKDEDLDRK